MTDPASENMTASLQRATAEMNELVLLSEVVLAECQLVMKSYAQHFISKKAAA